MAFLSNTERVELTGASTKKGQIEALRNNRIPFFVRADGWPVVTWEAVNGTLMAPVPVADTMPRYDKIPNAKAH